MGRLRIETWHYSLISHGGVARENGGVGLGAFLHDIGNRLERLFGTLHHLLDVLDIQLVGHGDFFKNGLKPLLLGLQKLMSFSLTAEAMLVAL